MGEGPVGSVEADEVLVLEALDLRVPEHADGAKLGHRLAQVVVLLHPVQRETHVELQLVVVQPAQVEKISVVLMTLSNSVRGKVAMLRRSAPVLFCGVGDLALEAAPRRVVVERSDQLLRQVNRRRRTRHVVFVVHVATLKVVKSCSTYVHDHSRVRFVQVQQRNKNKFLLKRMSLNSQKKRFPSSP